MGTTELHMEKASTYLSRNIFFPCLLLCLLGLKGINRLETINLHLLVCKINLREIFEPCTVSKKACLAQQGCFYVIFFQ